MVGNGTGGNSYRGRTLPRTRIKQLDKTVQRREELITRSLRPVLRQLDKWLLEWVEIHWKQDNKALLDSFRKLSPPYRKRVASAIRAGMLSVWHLGQITAEGILKKAAGPLAQRQRRVKKKLSIIRELAATEDRFAYIAKEYEGWANNLGAKLWEEKVHSVSNVISQGYTSGWGLHAQHAYTDLAGNRVSAFEATGGRGAGKVLDGFKYIVETPGVMDTLKVSLTDHSKAQLERIARTEGTRAYNRGMTSVYKEDDMVVGLEFVAVIDSRTCVLAGTKITTSTGCKNIEDVVRGDRVLTYRGRYKKVDKTRSSVYNGNIVKVCFGKGKVLKCTAEHPILVLRGEELLWVPAGVLRTTDYAIERLEIAPDEANLCCVRKHIRETTLGRKKTRGAVLLQNLRDGLPLETQSNPTYGASQRPQDTEKMRGLQKGNVSYTGTSSKTSVLFRRMLFQKHALRNNLQTLWQSFLRFENLSCARAISVLFHKLSRCCTTQRIYRSTVTPQMSSVWKDFSYTPSGDKTKPKKILLKGLSESPSKSLRLLWAEFPEKTTLAFLQSKVLSFFTNADHHRNCCSRRITQKERILPASCQDRQICCRLSSGTKKIDTGSRWRLLARKTCGKSTRTKAGQISSESRVPSKTFGGASYKKGRNSRSSDCFGLVKISKLEIYQTKTKVYNLDVEDDFAYVANGIIVHNSDVCLMLDGTRMSVDDPRVDEYTPPLHVHCRSQLMPIFVFDEDISFNIDEPVEKELEDKQGKVYNLRYTPGQIYPMMWEGRLRRGGFGKENLMPKAEANFRRNGFEAPNPAQLVSSVLFPRSIAKQKAAEKLLRKQEEEE